MKYGMTEMTQVPLLTIVGSILLASDQHFGMEKGPVWAGLDVIDNTRLQIDIRT